jgi:hypothetical protein
VQQGAEAGRLGIIVDAASKAFLEAAFFVRNKGDYGLDGDLDNLPRTLFGVGDIQIRRLKFTLFGMVQGRRFTRGPSSCSLKVSTGEGEAYDHPGWVQGPSDAYTPTECDKLPFAPTFSMSVGDVGSTGERQKPPLHVTVTQKDWESAILGNSVKLPFEIGPNLPAFTTICTLAQSAAEACPPGAKMGTATAVSKFVDKPLTGNVYAVEQAGVPYLPGLVADLRGRVNVQIKIATQIINGKYIQSTVTNVPDLPLTSFSMNLNGGDKGPLESKFDLCFRSDDNSKFRTMRPEVGFSAHSGKRTSSKPRLSVNGCKPAVSGALRGAGKRRPSRARTVTRHPDAKDSKSLSVTLPRGVSLVSKKVRGKGVKVRAAGAKASGVRASGKRTLTIAKLSEGSRSVKLSLRRGTLRLSSKARMLKRLQIKVVSTDTAGKKHTSKSAVRAKG